MNQTVDDFRAILAAYKQVMDASWPDMHPAMRERSRRWPTATAQELKAELAEYVSEASKPTCKTRLFWKIGPQFEFGGGNTQFAQDAGMSNLKDLIGITDFDPRLPWRPQAAKYRLDDEAVVASRTPQLDIIERMKSPNGDIKWLRSGKVPIVRTDGTVIGLLGMYEELDPTAGRTMFGQQRRRPGSKPDGAPS